MFTQPRLRRFLSRDKVHNFDVSYKPRCYLSPSEESTFRICLKSIYQPTEAHILDVFLVHFTRLFHDENHSDFYET